MKGFLVAIGIALLCLGFLYVAAAPHQPDLNIYDTDMPAETGLATLEVVVQPAAAATATGSFFVQTFTAYVTEKTWHASEVAAGCCRSLLRRAFRLRR